MTDEDTAGRSLKEKMLPCAKHMGLLENMGTVKDRLFQTGVQTGDKQISQPGPKKPFANWTATAQTQKWKTTRDTNHSMLQYYLMAFYHWNQP